MLKAVNQDRCLIYLGLTPENMERLKLNQPIAFPLSELGIERDGQIAIVWDSPEFRKHEDRLKDCLVFVLNDRAEEMMKDALLVPVEDTGETYCLYLRDTMEELQELIAKFVTEETTVIGPD